MTTRLTIEELKKLQKGLKSNQGPPGAGFNPENLDPETKKLWYQNNYENIRGATDEEISLHNVRMETLRRKQAEMVEKLKEEIEMDAEQIDWMGV